MKKTNDEKIIGALDALDKSRLSLMKFSERYNDYIDEAAMNNDQNKANQLIKQKLGVINLSKQLQTLKSNIELGALTATTVASLGQLPQMISGCKGLLSQSPNFSRVSKDLKQIFKDMKAPERELEKLNKSLEDIITPHETPTLESRLSGTVGDPLENSDAFKAEYEAMMTRIQSKVVIGDRVNTPTSVESNSDLTGDLDISDLIDEENKRK